MGLIDALNVVVVSGRDLTMDRRDEIREKEVERREKTERIIHGKGERQTEREKSLKILFIAPNGRSRAHV